MENINNIAKLVAGNLTPEEKKKVLSEIRTSAESRNAFCKIKAAWAVLSSSKKHDAYAAERTYFALQQRIHKRKLILRSEAYLKYAAVLLIVLSIPAIMYFTRETSSEIGGALKYTSVVADNGQVSKVILPDSSVVWLNSNTTLSYNSGYAVTNRDLKLNGEAYLEVTRDVENPLVVFCNDLQIKVLGTKFDVSAYSNDDEIQVVLESGSVQLLRSNDDSFRVLLHPGEMAQYNPKSKNVKIEKVNAADFMGWKEGTLVFSDVPMADVVKRLERKFNIEISIKNEEVYKSVFNANFRDESLAEILEYIEYSCPITCKTIEEDTETKTRIEFYYQPK
ncbi:FecR family protein [Mariniphaga anaerophila]|uniref:FecR family protein n=1 Tax=Mariniphaga anaerophila TaxID=1484053 RepID=A0A1M5F9E0_9BACT|nr:FecR family protein [Mariniphaga anaerophila]SHF88099.1 FecR family protein [Mariniphaga anaerophila]